VFLAVTGINTAYLALLAAIAPVFAAIGCGFWMRRTNAFDKAASPGIYNLAYNILYPCFIAHRVLTSEELKNINTVLITPVVAGGILLLSFAVTYLVSRLLRLGRPHPQGTFIFASGIQNWGFLPIPIILTFYPQAVGVLLLHSVGLELVMWSLGVYILSGEGSWKKALNVPFIAILASLILNLCHAQSWIPQFLINSLHFLGQGAIPLSLILTGMNLAEQVKEGGIYSQKRALIAGCVLRLVIFPIMILAIAKWVPMPTVLRFILVVQAAMPAAMIPVVLAKQYKADVGLSLGIIITTTILGFLTIPLWLRIGFKFLEPELAGYGN